MFQDENILRAGAGGTDPKTLNKVLIADFIQKKYPEIEFNLNPKFDFYINCTAYPKHIDKIKQYDPNKYFFIAHDIDMFIKQLPNVFFLTPLAKQFLYLYNITLRGRFDHLVHF